MAYRHITGEAFQLICGEDLADESHSFYAFEGKIIRIRRYDTAALLSPVLETEESVVYFAGTVLPAVDSEYSAFLVYCHAKILHLHAAALTCAYHICLLGFIIPSLHDNEVRGRSGKCLHVVFECDNLRETIDEE